MGALPCAIDVQNENNTKLMVDLALERFGRIDILVCSAGILRTEGAPVHPVSRLPVRNWDEVLDINLRGTFLCNRAVLSAMVRQRSGNIVNLSSVAAQLGFAFDAAYSSSKCGIIGFTESLAQEVQSHGVPGSRAGSRSLRHLAHASALERARTSTRDRPRFLKASSQKTCLTRIRSCKRFLLHLAWRT